MALSEADVKAKFIDPKIRENGWQLMPGRYKPVRLDAVEHDTPVEILADVIRMEVEITERAKALLEGLAAE